MSTQFVHNYSLHAYFACIRACAHVHTHTPSPVPTLLRRMRRGEVWCTCTPVAQVLLAKQRCICKQHAASLSPAGANSTADRMISSSSCVRQHHHTSRLRGSSRASPISRLSRSIAARRVICLWKSQAHTHAHQKLMAACSAQDTLSGGAWGSQPSCGTWGSQAQTQGGGGRGDEVPPAIARPPHPPIARWECCRTDRLRFCIRHDWTT